MEQKISKYEIEKKKFSKKKLISFVLIGILAMTLVTAALVGYISNKIQADVTITSPMKLLISQTDSSYTEESITFGTIHGGESVEFYTLTQNFADIPTTGVSWNIVSNPEGVTCGDFEVIGAETRSGAIGNSGSSLWTDTTSYIACVGGTNNYNVRIKVSPKEPWTWPANYEDNMHFTIKFATDASGTYTLTSQIVPTSP